MTLRNLAVNVLYYGVTVGLLPALVLAAEARACGRLESPWALRATGAFLGMVGIVLQGWCIALLQSRGGGTPSPAIPTVQLVTAGPYARVRNPLNVGEVLLFLGMAAWFASVALLLYAALAALAFHAFVLRWEEPRHRRAFGPAYAAYAAAVPRWRPRLRRHPPPGVVPMDGEGGRH